MLVTFENLGRPQPDRGAERKSQDELCAGFVLQGRSSQRLSVDRILQFSEKLLGFLIPDLVSMADSLWMMT